MVWGTYRFRKHTTLQNGKKWPKKVPQSARLSAGGGFKSPFGGVKLNGSSQRTPPLFNRLENISALRQEQNTEILNLLPHLIWNDLR